MYLFYTDETNLDPTTADFFVYGGIVVPFDQAKALSEALDQIRAAHGVSPNELLKFNPAPAGLNHDQFKALKQAVVEAAIAHGCKFITTLTLHRIAKDPADPRRFAINSTAYHFDCFLHRMRAHGLVLIDRFTDTQIDEQLRDRFAVGLRDMPFSKTMRLKNIVGFHYSAIGQSHFGTLIDVVLGSFRFAINAFTKNDAGRLGSAAVILQLLAPLFCREENGKASEISLHFSPMIVRSDTFRKQYEDLRTYLASNGIEAAQDIRG